MRFRAKGLGSVTAEKGGLGDWHTADDSASITALDSEGYFRVLLGYGTALGRTDYCFKGFEDFGWVSVGSGAAILT